MVLPSTPLISIGYEGRNLTDLIEQLRANDVRVLVDVRLNPVSRKPGLSKQHLAQAVEAEGIKYVHHRELGNPKDNREDFRAGHENSRVRYAALLETGPAARALQHVTELMDYGVVALLCFERDHSQCHRGLVAEAIQHELPDVELVPV